MTPVEWTLIPVIWKIFTLATRNLENEKEAEEVEDTVEYEEFEKYYYLIEFFVFNSLISVCPRELRTLSTSVAPSTRR